MANAFDIAEQQTIAPTEAPNQLDVAEQPVQTTPNPFDVAENGASAFDIAEGIGKETPVETKNPFDIARNIMFPMAKFDLLSPDKRAKVGKSLLSAKERTIGAIAQLPRMFVEQNRVASEDLPTMQMELLEGLGIDIPEPLRKAHKSLVGISIKHMNPLTGFANVIQTADRIPALKKLNDEVEKFAVDKIKNSETIRNGMMEHKESVVQLIKEGRISDVGDKIADLAIAEAPQLAIQAVTAYLSKGASLAYMGATAASSKYASLAEEDVSPIQRVGNSLGTGLTEYFSEKLGTGRVLDKAINGKLMASGAKKAKEVLLDAMGGAVSEGVASVGENSLDMLVGMDASLGDGVAEALILGAMFDGGTSVAGQINTANKIDRFKSGLIASGATEQEADSIIARSQKVKDVGEQREIDTEIGEILKRNKTDTDNDIKQESLITRAETLMRQESMSDEDRAELSDILQNINAVKSSEIESKMLRKDIHDLSGTNPFVMHPRDITRTTKGSELKETIDALEELYGYRPTKKQILDAFNDPMMRQEIKADRDIAAKKEQQLSELGEKVKQQKAGEISGNELLAFMEELDPEIAQEFIDRTTGDKQERPSDVIKDIIQKQKQQEVQDGDIKRSQETGAVEQGQATQAETTKAVETDTTGAQVVRAAEEGKVDGEPVKVEKAVEQPQKAQEGAKKAETLKPISEVKDEKIADSGKVINPPNPQLPFAKWYKQMMDFAVSNVQSKKTRAEFISDMEAEYLHYEATSEDLANIWNDAQVEAKRVADEVKKAEKVSAKAKITQKQFKDTETETVKSSELIKQLFRVQERASKQGRRAGINEIKQQIRDFKGDAQDLVSEMRTQMEGLKKATKLERANLKNALKDIQLAKTTEAQIKAFDNAIDLLDATFDNINERTPQYEYVPFADAETETGVDRNSKYKDIRAKFVEYGGAQEIRSATEMLKYLNGSETEAAGRFVNDEIQSLKERDERSKSSPMLRAINKLHRGGKIGFMGPGRYNMFDFLGHLSRGKADSNFGKLRHKLSETTRAAGTNMKQLQDKAAELNPDGKYTSKVMGTKVKIQTPMGERKVSLGEIIMVDMALENKDNARAMSDNDMVIDSGGKTFRADAKQYKKMVDDALSQVDAETRDAYEKSKTLYEEIVNMSGDMVGPVANQVMEELGMEPTFKKVDGKYVPIMLSDISTGEAIEIEVPDGSGGTETQRIADNYINREIHKGKFKKRVGGGRGGRIRVGNIDSVLSHIMDTSAEFAASGIVHNDMLKLLNNKALKTQINRTFGTHFSKALHEKAYQTTGTVKSLERTPIDRALSKAFSIVDPYRLSRPSTGLIMASSAQMVRPFLKNKESFGLGLKHGMNKFIQNKIKADGFLYSRYSGRAFSPELAEQGAKIKTRSGGETAETRASKLISWGDKGAISAVYTATAFDEMISKGLGTTMADLQTQNEAFWEDVGNRVAYETMRTQPSGTSSAVSVWKGRARNNIVARLLTRYGSQGSRIYNNVVDAVDEYAYNPSEENRQQLHRVLESQVITNTAILSGIKATRRSAKVATIVLIMSLLGRDEEEIEEMKEKRDEEIDKIFPSFFANFAKTQLKSIEGIDDILTFMDFLDKPYAEDPFAGVMTSELRDLKQAYQSYKTAQKWHEILESGVKETDINGRKVMRPISAAQRRRYEENYQNAVKRIMTESSGIALMMSRLPLAGLKDVSFGEDMIAEKFVNWDLNKQKTK